MNKNYSTVSIRKSLAATLLLAAGIIPGFAQTHSKDVYDFGQSNTPKEIKPYSCTVFTRDHNSIRNIRGINIHQGKDSIRDFELNPTGLAFGIVTSKKNKAKSEASIYSLITEEEKIAQIDTKLIGNPSSIVYFPDGRTMAVATDSGIYFLEVKKYRPYAKIENVPFTATSMSVSPNGYYLAATDGKKIAVYNIEERSLRKLFDEGTVVNDMLFSPDSSDFAVLTNDGLLNIYSTRTFEFRKMVDDLGEAIAGAYNLDGKYMAVVTSPSAIAVVNLLRDSEREYFTSDKGSIGDVCFILNSSNETFLVLPSLNNMQMRRMPNLKPYYNRLIADELESKMAEWEKMMPGETMDEYRNRVTEESRARQRRLFEDEISTNLAGNLLDGATMSLGSYDRANKVLALNFDSMPTIFLPVPESEVSSFKNAEDLSLSDVQYGILPDDSFEIVYAVVTNGAGGKQYTYDNRQRASMNYMAAEDAVSLEVLQQQQMEEIRLQELREKVVEEAKNMNVISDHTNITVDSRVVPDYDANGKKILNYKVTCSYDVDPQFSAAEDFGPGKYHVEESGAASSMLKIVKDAFEGDFRQYVGNGKKVNVKILGTADATPIVRGIPYDGAYGDIEQEPVYRNGELSAMTVTRQAGIKENDQLALVRALGVKDFLEKNVAGFKDMNKNYRYDVNVSEDKGSAFRRITVEFTFVDAY